MKRTIVVVIMMLSLVSVPDAQEPAVRAFVGARIVDGTGKAPIESAVLVVRGDRVESVGPAASTQVPAGADRVDVSGKTIVPGLVNAHGHVGDTRGLKTSADFYTEANVLDQLLMYARYGVTTVFSLGGDRQAGVAVRDRQRQQRPDRARLYVAGPVVSADDPAAARKIVDEVAAMKADLVKIRVDDNLGTSKKMASPVYEAVIDQAHKHGLRVAAHIFYLDDAKSLLKAGVDFLAHSIRDRDVDQELITMMRQRQVCLCPTLTREVSTFVYETTPAFFDDPFFLRHADRQVLEQLKDPKRQEAMRSSKSAQRYKLALKVASRNLKTLSDAGVRIAFGTDTGPPARFQGYFEHMEAVLMAKAGLSPARVLASATGDATRCMAVTTGLGTLAAGAPADFLVLGRNPLDDVRNLRTIESVWIAGRRLAEGTPTSQ